MDCHVIFGVPAGQVLSCLADLSSSNKMATMSGPASATRSRTSSPSQRVKSGVDASQQARQATNSSTSSRKTTANLVQPTRTTPHLRPLATILFATMIAGTVTSVYFTSADLTTFRSRIPASQLNRWELGSRLSGSGPQRAFPVPSLPYFADKVSRRGASPAHDSSPG